MSTTETVLEMVKRLTPEQQQKVIEYVQALKQEQHSAETDEQKSKPKSSWRDSPAVGMWKDREDMKDSVEWVRQMRKKHWHRS